MYVNEPDTTTVRAAFLRNVDTFGEKTFCTFLAGNSVEQISFNALYWRSMRYMDAFSSRGVKQGDIVVIMLQHSPMLYYSFLGAILLGAVPSFMPFPSPKQRSELFWNDHRILFDRINPRLLVTYAPNDTAATAALGSTCDIIVAGDVALDETSAGEPSVPAGTMQTEAIACLQHSSGTTALKKGVMLSNRSILAHSTAYARAIELRQSDRIVSWLPLYHDMGFVACFLTALLHGVELVSLDPFEWVLRPAILLDAIERYRGTLCWMPNFAYSHLANAVRPMRKWDLTSMRMYINCSEPSKPATFDRFHKRFQNCGVTPEQLHVSYAMAENVFAVTQTSPSHAAAILDVNTAAFRDGHIRAPLQGDRETRLLECGRPIDGVSVRIVDADRRELPNGHVGEIEIQSGFLFSGYYKLEEFNARVLAGGWYTTGDLGFVHSGGVIVTGRLDDMLIVNGRNYYAHEIESLLETVPELIPGRSIALSIDDATADSTVLILLAESREADASHVASRINATLSEHMGLVFRDVMLLAPGRLIKTTSGKLHRKKNRELYLSGKL